MAESHIFSSQFSHCTLSSICINPLWHPNCFVFVLYLDKVEGFGEGGKPCVTSLGSNEDLTFLLYSYMCICLECLCITGFFVNFRQLKFQCCLHLFLSELFLTIGIHENMTLMVSCLIHWLRCIACSLLIGYSFFQSSIIC